MGVKKRRRKELQGLGALDKVTKWAIIVGASAFGLWGLTYMFSETSRLADEKRMREKWGEA